jgi:predicted phage baseplate assembly protein
MRQTQEHLLMRRWLPLPGNVIALTELPEREAQKDYPPLESTVSLQLRERGGEWHGWDEKADLSFSGPGDRHFVVDRERGELQFGDGLTGRLPVLGDPKDTNVKLQYSVGGGSVGIVGENLKWDGVSISDVRAKNVVPSEGGAEPESIESARQRVEATLKRRDRAVIREDYEHIAETTSGVAIKRAHAAIGYHPDYPCSIVPGAVTVFVVPDAPREDRDDAWVEDAFVAAPQPDPGARAAVLARFQIARLVTTEVFVRGPRYRPVALSVTVEGDPADPQEMQRQIQMRLANFLDPLIGGEEQQGWPFGEPLRPSVLLREAQRPLANGEQVIAVSIVLIDTDQSAQHCTDVLIGPHDLVTLHAVTVRLNRTVAGSGGLR